MADQVFWQSCSVNCGSHCPLRFHVQDGNLWRVETDNLPETQEDCPQMRACARGRSIRFWLAGKNRLNWPMRRVGKRGSGRFERISWDEALSTIASEIRRIAGQYGNEAIFFTYGTGLYPSEGSPFERLMNCCGGYLRCLGDYSSAQLQAAMTYTYGDDGYYTGSTLSEAARASLVVFFGSNPAITRMGGGSGSWEFRRAREQGDFKLVIIDPRYSETLSGARDQWIPIRPGTDAALVAGLAYVMITEGLLDWGFLDEYCVGFDAKTLPDGAPANGSYQDYILGTGADGIAKTPQWASGITGVPVDVIEGLAREMAAAKPLYVAQGWGPQRRDNGELTARAIPLLALMTGNVGLPGTNTGARERFLPFTLPDDPVGENPIAVGIPAFLWSRAVCDGTTLTARNAGVQGAAELSVPIKMIFNHAGNCLTNQHADINRTHDILADESRCEFVVVCDVRMTDSARYADILLPDVARAEQENLVSSGSADIIRGVVHGGDWAGERYDRRPAFDVAAELADMLGVRAAFNAWGAAPGEVAQMRFEAGREADGRMAPLSDQVEGSFWRAPYEGETVGLAAFRRDPLRNPLPTPSGKIEIYSNQLADLASWLEYADDQAISPLPIYAPEGEGWDSALREDYPFQLIGFHCAGHAHSSYADVPELQAVFPHELWMNTVDARGLGIVSGMRVVVESPRGRIAVVARVTPLVMPGVLALPQGAWHDADMEGDRLDVGGCINTLTSDRPSPLARGNAQGTCLVRVRPADMAELTAADAHQAAQPWPLAFSCLGPRLEGGAASPNRPAGNAEDGARNGRSVVR